MSSLINSGSGDDSDDAKEVIKGIIPLSTNSGTNEWRLQHSGNVQCGRR